MNIFSSHDWVPTLLAAAGEPDIEGKLLKAGGAVATQVPSSAQLRSARTSLSARPPSRPELPSPLPVPHHRRAVRVLDLNPVSR